jgi:hypothetical protein
MLRHSSSRASPSDEGASRTLSRTPAGVRRARRRFLHFFPGGFRDETYVAWERDYKWRAHERWSEDLGPAAFAAAIRRREFGEIARRAVGIEARTNLLFSFEKMALRDGVKTPAGARTFAQGLHVLLHGRGSDESRFERWIEALERLPRRQTRVLTWPVATVFPFLADPRRHVFLKPNVTRRAAREYGFDFEYRSRPNWATYQSLLAFAAQVRRDQADLKPRDMIDLQSFVWVLGSDEYD